MISEGDDWIEFDENGVPLGRWVWDEELEMWVFEELPPPPLGGRFSSLTPGNRILIFVLSAIAIIGIGLTTWRLIILKKKHRNKKNQD